MLAKISVKGKNKILTKKNGVSPPDILAWKSEGPMPHCKIGAELEVNNKPDLLVSQEMS
jgi:hypothetical protein